MIIKGKEYGLAYTVEAMGMLDALYDEARVNNLTEYLSAPRVSESAIRTMKVAIALNRGYCSMVEYDDPDAHPNVLDFGVLAKLKQSEFGEVVDSIVAAINEGSEPDVEIDPAGNPTEPAGGEE